MNLFTARLTGKMLSTEQFEKLMKEMQECVIRWRQIEKSPELAEYKELKAKVESPEFQAKKKEINDRKYKDTDEGKKMAAYKRLSSQLRRYNSFNNFTYLKNLYALNSSELERLSVIEAEMATDDFKKRNAFWEDKNRWKKTEEYQIEKRYNELANSDDIKFYFQQRAQKIDWAELFRPAFADDMSSSKNWKPGFGYSNPALKDGHSYTSELQAYNHGKNTFFADGRMDIETRNANVTATAWDKKKGFIEYNFNYTSDVMNTKEAFAQEEGLFVAKVRSQGVGHHFLGLSNGKNTDPQLALYHYDGDIHWMGLENGKNSQRAKLTGVLRSMYHIYSLRWTKTELIWYVNDMEVLRIPNHLPKEKMFMLAQSFLPANEKGGEGKLKVQWVRIYRSVD